VGPIYFCDPIIGSTKSNLYLPFVILMHNQDRLILFTKIPNPCLLLPALLIIGEMTILSIHIFISLSTSSFLEEKPLFTDVVLFFLATNDCKTHKLTSNLYKPTSTTRSTETTAKFIFFKSYKPFLVYKYFFCRKI